MPSASTTACVRANGPYPRLGHPGADRSIPAAVGSASDQRRDDQSCDRSSVLMRRPAFFMPEYWRSEGGIEGALLRSVFFTLLTAAIIMLGTDLHDMLQRSGDVSPDSERTDPVIVEPPKDSDQERPYFPKAMPLAPNTSPAQFPGVPVPTTPKMLASPMAFTLDDSGNVAAIGRIEPGTSARFDAFLKDVGVKAKRVWLNSPGGALADALSMGQAIRKAGLGTVVPANAYCASSCPLVFVGGSNRRPAARRGLACTRPTHFPENAARLAKAASTHSEFRRIARIIS